MGDRAQGETKRGRVFALAAAFPRISAVRYELDVLRFDLFASWSYERSFACRKLTSSFEHCSP
jgi:hypothetical protein